MAILTAANFRTASLAEYCYNIPLTTTEAPDAALGSAISRFTGLINSFCNDDFELVNESAYQLTSDGTGLLIVPRRLNALYNLYTVDVNGNRTLENSGSYRWQSSLDASGAKRIREFDTIEIIKVGTGLKGTLWSPWRFDAGLGTVQIEADFGWVATPPDIRRAVALMVYDHFKPARADLLRVTRFQTDSAAFDLGQTVPTGIPEVDAIIAEYKHESSLVVG